MIRKPCIICGTLTTVAAPNRGARCEAHRLDEVNARARRRGKRPHYEGDYRKRAARVRATATECWICGQGPIDGDPWTADHITPGDPDSELRPAHRSCNARRGDAGKRARNTEPKPLF